MLDPGRKERLSGPDWSSRTLSRAAVRASVRTRAVPAGLGPLALLTPDFRPGLHYAAAPRLDLGKGWSTVFPGIKTVSLQKFSATR